MKLFVHIILTIFIIFNYCTRNSTPSENGRRESTQEDLDRAANNFINNHVRDGHDYLACMREATRLLTVQRSRRRRLSRNSLQATEFNMHNPVNREGLAQRFFALDQITRYHEVPNMTEAEIQRRNELINAYQEFCAELGNWN